MTEHWLLDELPEHTAPARPGSGRIRVTGVVRRPFEIGPAELAGMPQTTLTEDFDCEEGWTVPKQTWRGVRVGELIDAAGADGEGLWVEFAAGAYRMSLPIDQARNALVALTLNGSSLTPAHGGPCRLYVRGEACYTSIKWLDRIEVRQFSGPNQAEKIARQRLGDVPAARA